MFIVRQIVYSKNVISLVTIGNYYAGSTTGGSEQQNQLCDKIRGIFIRASLRLKCVHCANFEFANNCKIHSWTSNMADDQMKSSVDAIQFAKFPSTITFPHCVILITTVVLRCKRQDFDINKEKLTKQKQILWCHRAKSANKVFRIVF